MRVIRHPSRVPPPVRPRIVAAGRFDGVHRGHQAILSRVVERAAALRGEAIVVLARARGTRLLALRQQLERLRDGGVHAVVCVPGDGAMAAVAGISAAVRITADGGAGPAGAIAVETIDPVLYQGRRIDAEAIGAALDGGDLAAARAMLGRDPGVVGRVVHGFHRGRPLGIPTANLRIRGIRLPADGVYAVRATVNGRRLRGVANVGFNPTFGNQTRTVETHLLDFTGDLYGRRLELAFAVRLRAERKFPDVAALLAQINSDIEAARQYFADDGR